MAYRVPGTSEHRKILIFWYKQKSALPWSQSADPSATRVYSQGHSVAIDTEVSASGECSFGVERQAEYTVEVYHGLVGPT